MMLTSVRRIRHAFVAACLLILLLGGLSSDALGAPVVVQMALLLRATGRQWQEAVVEAFHKEQDRIRVELVGSADGLRYGQLKVLLVAGEAPQIIFQDPNNLLNWARQGFLVDLAPYLEREPRDSPFNDFFDITWIFYTLNEKVWAVPMDLQVGGVLYNEDAFQEAGQAAPWPGWTWDDLSRVAHRLTKRTSPDSLPDRWGLREPEWYFWWQAIWHYGGSLVDNWANPTAFTGDTKEVKDALRMYRDMVRAGVMAPPGTPPDTTVISVVAKGTSAMALGHSLWIQSAAPLAAEYQTDWNVAFLPRGRAGNTPVGNAIGWSIVKESGLTEEAFEVLRYFSGPTAMELAVQIRQGEILPHQPTMVRSWLRTQAVPTNRSIFLEALPHLRPLPLIEDSYKSIASRAAYDFWRDLISEDQAIENMRIGITQGIDANRAPGAN